MRALVGTWHFIRSRLGSGVMAVSSFCIGSFFWYCWYGQEAAISQFHLWVAYVLMGAIASLIVVLTLNWIVAPAKLLHEAEHERDILLSQISKQSPLSLVFPPEANLPNKVTHFREVTVFYPRGERAVEGFPSMHQFYIGVANESPRTIRNVTVRVYYANKPDRPVDLHLYPKGRRDFAVDLRPGDMQLFEFGKIILQGDAGFVGAPSFLGAREYQNMATVAKGYADKLVGLIVGSRGQKLTLLQNDGQLLRAAAHGDDIEPAVVEIVLNLKHKISVELRPVGAHAQ